MSDSAELSAALEAALVRELRRLYEQLNERWFDERLKRPVLALADTTRRLGQWTRATRTLELSRSLVFARPWREVIGVLEHEMAHQYVDEVLGVVDETPHGPTFQRVCAERGIDAKATGEGGEARPIDLEEAFRISQRTGREFLTVEEDYIFAAIRLLIERHLWGPRLFNDTSATVSGAGGGSRWWAGARTPVRRSAHARGVRLAHHWSGAPDRSCAGCTSGSNPPPAHRPAGRLCTMCTACRLDPTTGAPGATGGTK